MKSYLFKWFVPRSEFESFLNASQQKENASLLQEKELSNLLHQQSSLQQHQGSLQQYQGDLLQQLGERVLHLENQWPENAYKLQQQNDQLGMDMLSVMLHTREMLAQSSYPSQQSGDGRLSKRVIADPFDVYLGKFKNLYPHLYETWASVNFVSSVDEYKEHPERSCAVDNRVNARLFRGFVAPYLHGRILDVGCGTLAIPNYLQDYPTELISGIDPLEPFESHPFEFVRGFAEFLPWEDSSFDVVVAATSLDHTLSLELAFSEIRRVLKPGGHLLVWDWFAPDSKPYQPAEHAPELIDSYHLFHFSEDWFEAMVTPHFSIYEKIRLYGIYQYDRFYALQLKR